MNRLAIAAGALVAALGATAASAQVYYGRTYDPYWSSRNDFLAGRQECWNPRARHFEQVRPGEYQDDLDFSRCRVVGDTYAYREYRDSRGYRETREECWNPRARHFEQLRPGEWQDDLDRSRCRIVTEERYR